MTIRIHRLVRCCKECPNYSYYSGGRHECTAVDQMFPPGHEPTQGVPAWCPLIVYPSGEIVERDKTIETFRALATELQEKIRRLEDEKRSPPS